MVCNFSPASHYDHCIGVPVAGRYERVFSSFDLLPEGGGPGKEEEPPVMLSIEGECDDHPRHLRYSLRPFEAIIVSFPKESE